MHRKVISTDIAPALWRVITKGVSILAQLNFEVEFVAMQSVSGRVYGSAHFYNYINIFLHNLRKMFETLITSERRK